MTLAEIKAKEIEKHEKLIAYIDSLEGQCIPSVAERINFVSIGNDKYFFVEGVDSISDVFDMISGYKYDIGGYYMCNGALHVRYEIDEYKYLFIVKDYTGALERISSGKCKIVQKNKVDLQVECGV